MLISNECIFDYGNNSHTELNQYLLMELLRHMRANCDEEIELKVMMTIRNQKEIIKSFYAFEHKNGHLIERFNSFDEFISYGLENESRIVFGGYHYDLVLETMQEIYGIDNVRFFVYEKMKEDVEAYVDDILNFIGVSYEGVDFDFTRKVNVNSNEGEYHVKELKQDSLISIIMSIRNACRGNKFFSFLEHIKLFKTLKRNFSSAIREKVDVSFSRKQLVAIDELYSNSNTRLTQLLGMDMRKYGYVCKKIG